MRPITPLLPPPLRVPRTTPIWTICLLVWTPSKRNSIFSFALVFQFHNVGEGLASKQSAMRKKASGETKREEKAKIVSENCQARALMCRALKPSPEAEKRRKTSFGKREEKKRGKKSFSKRQRDEEGTLQS